MVLFKTVADLRAYLHSRRYKQQIGLVPTMGALHQGHVSLIERAIAENDLVVVSIFVNPLQFAPSEDLHQYPRSLEKDYRLCQQLGANVVFAPTTSEMGIAGNTDTQNLTTSVVPPASMTSVLCAPWRGGHFTGVATIVTKLLNIVQPDRAYFGEKDAQQLAIIRRLVTDLSIPIQIRACPIVREPSGLALSSRNQYLNLEEKERAVNIYRSLQQAKQAFLDGETKAANLIEIVDRQLAIAEIKVQYIEIVHPQTLEPLDKIDRAGLLAIACYLGSTRLIDNLMLQRQSIIAIDGPAGAGKSTVTRRVAQKLGLLYLDTGAMYRAVTWLVMESGINLEDTEAIARLVKDVKIELIPPSSEDLPTQVWIEGKEVTEAIRTLEVTANVSTVAAIGAVRQELVRLQQSWGEKGGAIAEGRDIGTHVFPDAELKIFLTASAAERARRRLKDLEAKGYSKISLEKLTEEIRQRDERDSSREIAPLQKADDAIELITDGMSIEEVTAKIVSLYRQTTLS